MNIDWSALLKVALVSLAFGVGIVSIFSVGVVGLARASSAERRSPSPDEVSFGSDSAGMRRAAFALSGLSFAGCAAAMCYGLYLIIPQFH